MVNFCYATTKKISWYHYTGTVLKFCPFSAMHRFLFYFNSWFFFCHLGLAVVNFLRHCHQHNFTITNRGIHIQRIHDQFNFSPGGCATRAQWVQQSRQMVHIKKCFSALMIGGSGVSSAFLWIMPLFLFFLWLRPLYFQRGFLVSIMCMKNCLYKILNKF